MSARDGRARDIARWRRLTMTDEQLREIGRVADQKLADEERKCFEIEWSEEVDR